MRFAYTIPALALLFILSGCFGHSSTSNELVGQPKKIMHNTPLICPDFYDVDVSLGVMRNGVGSMSAQDKWLYVPTKELADKLKLAVDGGKLVKVTYDVERVRICVHLAEVTGVQILD